MRDFWVDGHYIAATNEDEARSEAAALYEFTPKVVREWTSEDQAALDWNDDADRLSRAEGRD